MMTKFVASAPELVTALGGRWHGRRSSVRCPGHPDRTPSLSISQGDDGRPLLYCHAGCSQEAVLDALRLRGLWPDRGERVACPAHDPGAIGARRHEEAEQRQHRLARARAIWREAAANSCRDLVVTYLRSREITIEPPPTIRSGCIWHPFERRRMPAMVAAIQGADGRLQGVSVTYLRADGAGKAEIEQPRLTRGELLGGAVRLKLAGPKLGLAEGLEDAATVQQETGLPCWAALGTSNLPKLTLPAVVRELVIIADRGQAGETAAQGAVQAYVASDRAVYIAWPPDGHQDFNAALQAAARTECAP
jgi:putative DNA primase/helicase